MIESPSIWFTIIAFFLVIGPLIFIHEMGHYLAARWLGVKIDTFSIGFGREITGWTDRRATRWKVGWLPLGGYVKFEGDMDAASRPDAAAAALSDDQKTGLFQFQPVWKRIVIVAAGPAINFLLAILIFMITFASYGQPQTPPVVSALIEGSAAEDAGFDLNDRILAVDGREIERFEELTQIVAIRPGQQMQFRVRRDGRELTINTTPRSERIEDQFGNQANIGRLGIYALGSEMTPLEPWEIPGAAVRRTGSMLEMIVVTLGQIVTGNRSVKELGGPLRIAEISGQQASLGLFAFFMLMAAISINLGFINLLPIPMLDGGHLVFYFAEAVRRKPVGAEAQEWAFRMGLAVLLGFMIMVTFIDLGSFGLWQSLGGLIG